MPAIRVQCPTPGCEDTTLTLTNQRIAGVLIDECPTCGKSWRMRAGTMIEIQPIR